MGMERGVVRLALHCVALSFLFFLFFSLFSSSFSVLRFSLHLLHFTRVFLLLATCCNVFFILQFLSHISSYILRL